MGEEPVRGVVLSGGGARGAYELGVLKYILTTLSDAVGRQLHFDVIAGTSVGALNGGWLAATADDPRAGIAAMETAWRGLRAADFFHLSNMELVRVWRALLGGLDPRLQERKDTGGRLGGLLNTAPIDGLVRRNIPWHRITPNIQRGHLRALSVTTTEIATGRTVVFAQHRDGDVGEWSFDPRRKAVSCTITAHHGLASAAIPLLFPAVQIGGRYYCDGFLRQNTPVTPALRLGADRVLIIALRSAADDAIADGAPNAEEEPYPGLFRLLGKLLNSMLLNPLEYDLRMLDSFNALHEHARADYPPAFQTQLNQLMHEVRGAGLRRVQHLLLRPSRDIGALTAGLIKDRPEEAWGRGLPAALVKRLADPEGDRADLLSYILFDGDYADALIQLGWSDAQAQHDALAAFFEA